jgi:hypothetical protein
MTTAVRPRTRLASLLVLFTALVIAVVTLAAGPAQAHTRLESSSPAPGATVPAGTGELVLSFNQPVSAELAVVQVTGPDGEVASTGRATASGSDIVQRLRAPLAAGAWTAAYRVVSADGHPISGTYDFAVAAPVAPSTPAATTSPAAAQATPPASTDPAPPAAADAEPTSSETPLAVPATVGVVVLGAAGTLLAVRRRRRGPIEPTA